MSKMTAYYLVTSALVLCLVLQCHCQSAILTVNPTTLNLNINQSSTGGLVTVTCRLPSSPNIILASMVIKRVLHKATEQVPVDVVRSQALLNGGDPELLVNTFQGTVSGGTDTGTLELKMNQAKCSDGGMYTCEVGTQNPIQAFSADTNLTVVVRPDDITLTPDPSGITEWMVNDTLRMTCNGPVGTVNSDTQVTWVWGYRLRSDFPPYNFLDNYDGLESDIQDGVTTSPGSCYQNRISTLIRQLTLADTDRVYYCFIRKDGVDYTDFAATHSVGIVTTAGPGTGTGGSDAGSAAAAANVGAIVGGVIGALIIIVVIIVIVFFVLRRRKKQKEDGEYQTGELPKPADEAAPPYTTSDPEVTYSQPNRFRDKGRGHSNKAMDREPVGEKPEPYDTKPYDTKPYDSKPASYDSKPARYESKPARYENDFNQGRRNQAYDYGDQPRSRRYSSDDGGTDSHVNTSQHSIGDGDPTMGTAI